MALLLLLLCNARAPAMDVSFHQIDWLADGGGYTSQMSDWGEVIVQFTNSDSSLFTQNGSSYAGYVNIVTTVPGGSTDNWAVMNDPVVFNSLGDFDSGFPQTMYFSLGVVPGTITVTSLQYTLSIDSAPRTAAPSGPMTAASVGVSQLLFGGLSGEDDGVAYDGDSGQGLPPPAFNFVGAFPGETAGEKAQISVTNLQLMPLINVDICGCVPESTARSLKYLIGTNLTNSAQYIYDTLKGSNYMNSNLSTNARVIPGSGVTNATTGTTTPQYFYGKTNYTTNMNLGITTMTNITNFSFVSSNLSNGADVEVNIWGWKIITTNYTTTTNSQGVITTNATIVTKFFRHLAMLTSMTTIYTNTGTAANPTNVVSGYVIVFIDCGVQGTNSTSNRVGTLVVDTNGLSRTTNAGPGFTNIFTNLSTPYFHMETTNPPSTTAYGTQGGGKFLTDDLAASILRVSITGTAQKDFLGNLSGFADTMCSLNAFDFASYTEIESQNLAVEQASIAGGGGNFTFVAGGAASVNGVTADITFQASSVDGVLNYEISDADTGQVYASGTGEENRAAMALETSSSAGAITGLNPLPGGAMQITASGFPSMTYSVQATTNLAAASWETIGAVTSDTNGVILYRDQQATNFPSRVYRLSAP